MKISITQLLHVSDVQELKSLGSYRDAKAVVENHLGFKLGVQGWESLFHAIETARTSVAQHRGELLAIGQCSDLTEAKNSIAKLTGWRLNAQSMDQLREQLERVVHGFGRTHPDPYQRFEQTKLRNFRSSSRLEGIEAGISSLPLDSIIAKYKRAPHG
jgi:hypothetical protein